MAYSCRESPACGYIATCPDCDGCDDCCDCAWKCPDCGVDKRDCWCASWDLLHAGQPKAKP